MCPFEELPFRPDITNWILLWKKLDIFVYTRLFKETPQCLESDKTLGYYNKREQSTVRASSL